MCNKNLLVISIVIISVLFLSVFAGEKNNAEKGVYEFVSKKVTVPFDSAAAALEKVIVKSKFELLAKNSGPKMESCNYRSMVFVLYDKEYARRLLKINRKTGSFAAADRITLFEDEAGLHVSILNPANINRTVLMEDEKYNQMSEIHRHALRILINAAVSGEESHKQYGQIRDEGHIGRTFGVMAGGSFDGKIKDVLVTGDLTLAEIVEKLGGAFTGAKGEWKLQTIYTLTLPEEQTAIIGISSPIMERKSFQIVKAGSDDAREDYSCPGLAHAAAYPIEVVISAEEEMFKIQLVNVMFRMKMFFEDAGKWAFMKNMGMPGSIEDEIKGKIKSAVAVE